VQLDQVLHLPALAVDVMSKPPRIPRFMLKALARERVRSFDLEQRIYDGDVSYPVEPHVAGLQTATLIIWGAEDRSHNPAGAGILHGLLPQSQVILLAGVGHMPMVEDPERCASEYLKFRQSLTKSDRPFCIPTPPAGAGSAMCGAR
jgi:pimeloyl-ACP methyl ester carboxylesterase